MTRAAFCALVFTWPLLAQQTTYVTGRLDAPAISGSHVLTLFNGLPSGKPLRVIRITVSVTPRSGSAQVVAMFRLGRVTTSGANCATASMGTTDTYKPPHYLVKATHSCVTAPAGYNPFLACTVSNESPWQECFRFMGTGSPIYLHPGQGYSVQLHPDLKLPSDTTVNASIVFVGPQNWSAYHKTGTGAKTCSI